MASEENAQEEKEEDDADDVEKENQSSPALGAPSSGSGSGGARTSAAPKAPPERKREWGPPEGGMAQHFEERSQKLRQSMDQNFSKVLNESLEQVATRRPRYAPEAVASVLEGKMNAQDILEEERTGKAEEISVPPRHYLHSTLGPYLLAPLGAVALEQTDGGRGKDPKARLGEMVRARAAEQPR